jgi:hypothetical protein
MEAENIKLWFVITAKVGSAVLVILLDLFQMKE